MSTLQVNQAVCKGCGLCIGVCPAEALGLSGQLNALGYEHIEVDHDKCIGCGSCYIICPEIVFTLT